MPTHQLHSSYSRAWADEVVRSWAKKCPRGYKFIQEQLSVTHDQLVLLLAQNRPEWAQLRDMGKQYDRWCAKQDAIGIPIEGIPFVVSGLKDGIIQMFKNKIEKGLYFYLTTNAK